MKFELLDTVVLARDLPEHGLRAGDLGAVVETYGADGLEVEFVQASGHTKAPGDAEGFRSQAGRGSRHSGRSRLIERTGARKNADAPDEVRAGNGNRGPRR